MASPMDHENDSSQNKRSRGNGGHLSRTGDFLPNKQTFQLYMYNYQVVLNRTIGLATGEQVNSNRLAYKNEVATIHIAASFTHNNKWKNERKNPLLET